MNADTLAYNASEQAAERDWSARDEIREAGNSVWSRGRFVYLDFEGQQMRFTADEAIRFANWMAREGVRMRATNRVRMAHAEDVA